MNKLNNSLDLLNLEKILKKNGCKKIKHIFSDDYVFETYCMDETMQKTLKIRQENVFKLNIDEIVRKFGELLGFKINYYALFEESTIIEPQLKMSKHCWKHDCIIRLQLPYNQSAIEICLEYDEYDSHNKNSTKLNDKRKILQSNFFCDSFISYKESKNPDEHAHSIFYNDLIYKIFQYTCSMLKDKYLLAKIIYFRNYNGNNIKLDTELFDMITDYAKTDKINLSELVDQLMIKNESSKGCYCYDDEFKEFVLDTYEIELSGEFCNYDTFCELITEIEGQLSRNVKRFKKIMLASHKKLTEAGELIIELLDANSDKKYKVNKFVTDFIENDIHSMKDINVINELINDMSINNTHFMYALISKIEDALKNSNERSQYASSITKLYNAYCIKKSNSATQQNDMDNSNDVDSTNSSNSSDSSDSSDSSISSISPPRYVSDNSDHSTNSINSSDSSNINDSNDLSDLSDLSDIDDLSDSKKLTIKKNNKLTTKKNDKLTIKKNKSTTNKPKKISLCNK